MTMKSYEIWLKGGASLKGTMSEDDAHALAAAIAKRTKPTMIFVDGDGDTVVIDVAEIAAFAFCDDIEEKRVGFNGSGN